jgi:hypothetical protein
MDRPFASRIRKKQKVLKYSRGSDYLHPINETTGNHDLAGFRGVQSLQAYFCF